MLYLLVKKKQLRQNERARYTAFFKCNSFVSPNSVEKAAKIQMRQDKSRSSPPPPSSQHHLSMTGSGSNMASSSSSSRARAPVSPQKQSSSGLKSRGPEPSIAKTAPKMTSGGNTAMAGAGGSATAQGTGSSSSGGSKVKKSMSSRREELLKQLKAVEDAIARKKTKLT